MPGDPVNAMLSPGIRPELRQAAYDAMFIRLGLDRPLYEQYFRWLYNFIFVGDFGFSTWAQRPVIDAIRAPLLNTIILNVCVNIFYLVIALPVAWT